MLTYILGLFIILIVVTLFWYLPRRIFFAFTLLLTAALGIAFYLHTQQRAPEPLTIEERAAIAREQELFMPWWGAYQKQIAEMDRHWTRYHQILSDAKKGETELPITHARLLDLEQDMQALHTRINENPPPSELSSAVYDPLAVIMAKTNDYLAAQQKTVTLTRAAADPQTMKERNPAEQARLLELVMLRESPIALFVGDEIMMIRRYFAPVSAAHERAYDEAADDEKELDK